MLLATFLDLVVRLLPTSPAFGGTNFPIGSCPIPRDWPFCWCVARTRARDSQGTRPTSILVIHSSGPLHVRPQRIFLFESNFPAAGTNRIWPPSTISCRGKFAPISASISRSALWKLTRSIHLNLFE